MKEISLAGRRCTYLYSMGHYDVTQQLLLHGADVIKGREIYKRSVELADEGGHMEISSIPDFEGSRSRHDVE